MECAESSAAIWVTWGERSVFTGVVKRADGRKILLDDPRGELDSAGRALSEDACARRAARVADSVVEGEPRLSGVAPADGRV